MTIFILENYAQWGGGYGVLGLGSERKALLRRGIRILQKGGGAE